MKKLNFQNFYGKCVLDITLAISSKSCFSRYTWLDEMQGNAILNCITVLKKGNFDETKSDNLYGYLTKIIFYSFFRTMKKEKKMLEKEWRLLNYYLLHGIIDVEDKEPEMEDYYRTLANKYASFYNKTDEIPDNSVYVQQFPLKKFLSEECGIELDNIPQELDEYTLDTILSNSEEWE